MLSCVRILRTGMQVEMDPSKLIQRWFMNLVHSFVDVGRPVEYYTAQVKFPDSSFRDLNLKNHIIIC